MSDIKVRLFQLQRKRSRNRGRTDSSSTSDKRSRRIDRFLVRAGLVTKIVIPWITIVLMVTGTVSSEQPGHLPEILEAEASL